MADDPARRKSGDGNTVQRRIAAALSIAGLVSLAAGSGVPVAAQQPAASVDVPEGRVELGTIDLPRSVRADGEPLSAGRYEIRLTAETAAPPAVGALDVLERWVEFRQDGEVRGREVATLVPQSEIGDVANSAPPAAGAPRVEPLRGNEYLRVWINHGGTHYLIHLAVD